MPLPAADAALVSTIYAPPRARRPWLLSDVLPPGAATYYSLARWALVDALRACGVGPGDRVLMPGLICRDVLAATSFLGATPAFHAVSPRLAAELDAATPSAKAVLAVNYFGFPQDLDPARGYCHRTGAALIEDNAHGLFSRDEGGRWLGGRGDAGVFSFRKTIAVSGGAALVLGDRPGMTQATQAAQVDGSSLRYEMKQAFRRVAGRLGPLGTTRVIAGVRRLRGSVTGNALPVSRHDAETRIPEEPNPPLALGRLISVADPELEAERRRGLYAVAARLLEHAGVAPLIPELPDLAVPYGCPFIAMPGRMRDITASLAQHGLPVAGWPDLPLAVAASAPDHYRHLHVVPFLW